MGTNNEREAEFQKKQLSIKIKMMIGLIIPLIIMIVLVRLYFSMTEAGTMENNVGLILSIGGLFMCIMYSIFGMSVCHLFLSRIEYSTIYNAEIIDFVKTQGPRRYELTYRFQNENDEWLEKKGAQEITLSKDEEPEQLVGQMRRVWYTSFVPQNVMTIETKEEIIKNVFSGRLLVSIGGFGIMFICGTIYAIMLFLQ